MSEVTFLVCPHCGIADREGRLVVCRNCGGSLLSDPMAAHVEALQAIEAGGDVEAALDAIAARYDIRKPATRR